MSKRWRVRSCDHHSVEQLERSAGISRVVAELLVHRGVTNATDAESFLTANLMDLRPPGMLPGVKEAAKILHDAIKSGKKITIYGDYDADGMTSTSILLRCFALFDGNANYYVPNRLNEGYGLNDEAIEQLAKDGTQVIVTVDNGIASVAQALTARRLGIELIITDHHEMADELPQAAAIVHPRLPGHNYPFDGLCGAGVALKLAWAICQLESGTEKVNGRCKDFLVAALGLAAIGTVADVVPLVDENRLIVKHGLNSLKFSPVEGVAALCSVARLVDKPQFSSEDIAFSMAPRLNAAGRLGQADLAIELLTTADDRRARGLAEYLQELNVNRDSIERSIYLAANKQLKERFDAEKDPAIVLAGRGWHVGVIGIVAGRIAEKYSRPCVMIALDELGKKVGTGSARSAWGLNLHQALAKCSDDLITFGGHAAAAGLRIDEQHIDQFRTHFCERVEEEVPPDQRVDEIVIDAEAPLPVITLTTVKKMELMAPFGAANPRPLLCAKAVKAVNVKTMGASKRHLAMSIQHGAIRLRGIAFGKGEWYEELTQQEGPVDIAYRPVINEYNGRRSVELHLADWKPSVESQPQNSSRQSAADLPF